MQSRLFIILWLRRTKRNIDKNSMTNNWRQFNKNLGPNRLKEQINNNVDFFLHNNCNYIVTIVITYCNLQQQLQNIHYYDKCTIISH